MPLYECYCGQCETAFEVLLPLREASAKSHSCPECGRRARRMLSAVTLGRGGREEAPPERAPAKGSDVTRLSLPPPAQICWMDKPSTSRYAAYLHGRGAEYDETVAGQTEKQRQSGVPAKKKPKHDHGDSPLADPAVYARRRAAAKRSAAKAAGNSKA